MAIPTNFGGFTPAANTTKSFKVLGSATVGLWALDVDGTLAPTTSRIEIGPNAVLLMSQAYTDAQLIPLLKDLLARTEGHFSGLGAGGQKIEGSKQAAVSATTCT